ncbi:MAG TPA: PLP-dependent lyase/thiolase [Gaiellales bacterium]
MPPTRLEPAPAGLAAGRDVWLKREDEHELGAFKWRGALPAMRAFRDAGATTVVTASTGNHGAASAWAANRLGMRAIVYAPEGSSRAKLALIERHGGEIRISGADFDLAKAEAERVAAEEGVPFFADGAEEAQYRGYAAIAEELLEQLDRPPGAVVVPVGNGALLGGIGARLAERSPGTLRVGVVAAAAPVMAECWEAGRVVERGADPTIADGLAVRVAIPYAVGVLAEAAQRMLRVDERELAQAIGALAGMGIRVEASAAAALAALPQVEEVAGPVVLIVTGRNIDDALYRRAVDDPGSFPTRNATA